jgi:hypothetical protein
MGNIVSIILSPIYPPTVRRLAKPGAANIIIININPAYKRKKQSWKAGKPGSWKA